MATNEKKHLKGTRTEWRAARIELLKAEKEHTRRGDELARLRQELPWVRVDKQYRFDTDAGTASLANLFQGRSQLLVYHFMLGPDYKAGCPSCSAIADGFNGFAVHLANHDVMLTAVSRAPLAKLQAYKRRMGWSFPWVSSLRNDFNLDYGVSLPVSAGPSQPEMPRGPGVGAGHRYNFTKDAFAPEMPGLSAFALEDGVVYHTYSCYARGLDAFNAANQLLDRAPKGRDEDGLPVTVAWLRRHDEYEPATTAS